MPTHTDPDLPPLPTTTTPQTPRSLPNPFRRRAPKQRSQPQKNETPPSQDASAESRNAGEIRRSEEGEITGGGVVGVVGVEEEKVGGEGVVPTVFSNYSSSFEILPDKSQASIAVPDSPDASIVQEYESRHKTTLTTLQARLSHLTTTLSTSQQQIASAREELDKVHAANARLSNDVKRLEEVVEEGVGERERLRKHIDAHETTIENLNTNLTREIAARESQIQNVRSKYEEDVARITEEAKKENEELTITVNSLKATLQTRSRQLQLLRADQTVLQTRVDMAEATAAELTKELEREKGDVVGWRSKCGELELEIKNLEKKLAYERRVASSAALEVQDQSITISSLQTRLRRRETHISILRTTLEQRAQSTRDAMDALWSNVSGSLRDAVEVVKNVHQDIASPSNEDDGTPEPRSSPSSLTLMAPPPLPLPPPLISRNSTSTFGLGTSDEAIDTRPDTITTNARSTIGPGRVSTSTFGPVATVGGPSRDASMTIVDDYGRRRKPSDAVPPIQTQGWSVPGGKAFDFGFGKGKGSGKESRESKKGEGKEGKESKKAEGKWRRPWADERLSVFGK